MAGTKGLAEVEGATMAKERPGWNTPGRDEKSGSCWNLSQPWKSTSADSQVPAKQSKE